MPYPISGVWLEKELVTGKICVFIVKMTSLYHRMLLMLQVEKFRQGGPKGFYRFLSPRVRFGSKFTFAAGSHEGRSYHSSRNRFIKAFNANCLGLNHL